MTLLIDTKPTLEWVEKNGRRMADGYEVHPSSFATKWYWTYHDYVDRTYYKLADEAKAAAQADYERRTAERFKPITLPERMSARQGDGSVHYCAGWNDVLDALDKARGEV